MIIEKYRRKLQLDEVLEQVAAYAHTDECRVSLVELSPSSDIEKVNEMLALTAQAKRALDVYSVRPDCHFDDIIEAASRAKINSVLSTKQLLRVMRLLRSSRLARQQLLGINDDSIFLIKQTTETLYINKTIEDDIDFCILSEDVINDKATPELYSIRQKIRRTNDDIKAKLQSIIRSAEMQKYLQDSIVTLRGDRYVVPVKSEYRSNVSGLIHDQSSSGATVFIEPFAVVELNNQLKVLLSEEELEIERLLRAFTSKIAVFADELSANQRILVDLDMLFCKAAYANDWKCTLPIMNAKGKINIKRGRHPLINKQNVVPVSLYVNETDRILLVTGPNTGGKTVSMKLAGLFVLLACCGIFLPCDEDSEVSIFDSVFCDIGDEQSIEQSLSTFSSHISNIAYIMREATQKSLVLLDELGAGTEPNEGAALALAITESLLQLKCRAIITTHYGQLKEFSLVTGGIANASMEFNPATFEPTYKLVVGVPGSSNAIEIAKRIGLDEAIILNARSKLSQEKVDYDNIIRRAEQIRQDNEQMQSEISAIREQLRAELVQAKNKSNMLSQSREQLLSNSNLEAKRIIQQAQSEAEELLEQMKKYVQHGALEEKAMFEGRAIIKQIASKKYAKDDKQNEIFVGRKLKPEELAVGGFAYSPKLNSQVKIKKINARNVDVAVNNIVTTLPSDELYECEVEKPKFAKGSSQNAMTTLNDKSVSGEINLLGSRVEEAIVEVDLFLDSCKAAGLTEVRVVHGMGTGALRKGLHIHFSRHPRVKSYRLGRYGEGESGVTIVTLK